MAGLTDCQTEVNKNELNYFVHFIISNYLISDSRLQQFQDETQNSKPKLWFQYVKSGFFEQIRSYNKANSKLSDTFNALLKSKHFLTSMKLDILKTDDNFHRSFKTNMAGNFPALKPPSRDFHREFMMLG